MMMIMMIIAMIEIKYRCINDNGFNKIFKN